MRATMLERPADKTFDFIPEAFQPDLIGAGIKAREAGFNQILERAYPIKRNGKDFDVYCTTKGLKVRRRVKGGATASTPQSQASAAQAALGQYLGIAPTKFYTILGTIASGTSGGGQANVVWQQPIPIIPAFCSYIDYIISLSVTVTVTSGSVILSPFAPYSAFSQQMTLGGAPPWPFTELTPWHLDESFHRVDYDPAYSGLGGQTATNAALTNPAFTNIIDFGPTPIQIGGTGSASPGATISATATINFTFTVRQQLQRKRHLMWGAVPFGDPENRPNNQIQLNSLIGTNPESSLFVNPNAGSVTAVTAATCNVYAVYGLSYIDLLPPSVAQPPSPAVGYGLQLTPSSPSGQSAGNIFLLTHRTAQVYTAMHHLLVNNQQPLRADYFGLWDDQDQQSARWSYDAQANTFQEYFNQFHRNNRRYPQAGVYTAELDDGLFPEVPAVTPYKGLMSPDASYAQAFDIPVTPAMTTALRIPTGTTLNNPYIRSYEFGLVRVPY